MSTLEGGIKKKLKPAIKNIKVHRDYSPPSVLDATAEDSNILMMMKKQLEM